MGPIWGREDPGGPHVGPMNLLSGYGLKLPGRFKIWQSSPQLRYRAAWEISGQHDPFYT